MRITVLISILVALCLSYYILDIAKVPPGMLKHAVSADITWQHCWFPTPTLTAIYCGYLHPDEGTHIPIVIIRRSLFTTDLKPLLYVGGGPGGPTIPPNGNIEYWIRWLEYRDFDRDLVLFDFLGTGRSAPTYSCPQDKELARQDLAAPSSVDEQFAIYQPLVRDCYHDLTAKNLDLAKLTLPYTVRYVSRLIKTIPEASWDVYGVSYGTRVVLELMRRAPGNVRKVVLDSPIPPDIDMDLEEPRLTGDALRNLFASCRRDLECQYLFPGLEYEFYELVKRLDEQPVEFQVPHPETGELVTVIVTGHRLVTLVYQSMYNWYLIEQLPAALWALTRGDKEPLQPLVEILSFDYFDDTFNGVVWLSARCSERWKGTSKEVVQEAARAFPALQDYFSRRWKYDMCEHWSVPTLSDDYWRPVRSSLPTLILAGELDPVTPPDWARRIRKDLPNSYFLLVRSIGHGAVDSARCAIDTMRDFLNERLTPAKLKCGESTRGLRFARRHTAQ